MDNLILQELKRVVEQAVRPVRATVNRKLRMREELLGHVTAIFEEEVAKLGDEHAALDQTKRRFGDPRELTGQLQETVPRWDRCRSMLENMGCQPSESAWHLAARYFLVLLTLYSIPMLGISMLLAQGKVPNLGPMESQHILVTAFVLGGPLAALFNVLVAVILAFFMYKIGPGLTSRRWGRVLLVVLCVFVVFCGLSPLFTGAALLFLLMAYQTVKQRRYQKGWV